MQQTNRRIVTSNIRTSRSQDNADILKAIEVIQKTTACLLSVNLREAFPQMSSVKMICRASTLRTAKVATDVASNSLTSHGRGQAYVFYTGGFLFIHKERRGKEVVEHPHNCMQNRRSGTLETHCTPFDAFFPFSLA